MCIECIETEVYDYPVEMETKILTRDGAVVDKISVVETIKAESLAEAFDKARKIVKGIAKSHGFPPGKRFRIHSDAHTEIVP